MMMASQYVSCSCEARKKVLVDGWEQKSGEIVGKRSELKRRDAIQEFQKIDDRLPIQECTMVVCPAG
jgi:hypothetical protein